jgi:hypothetical protein
MKKETIEERINNLEQQLDSHKKVCFSQRRWLILGVLISTISLVLRLSEQKKQKEGPLIEYINELIIKKDENNPNPNDSPGTEFMRSNDKP